MFFKRRKIQKEIDAYKEKIVEIERKLSRSQSGCLNSILANTEPSSEDLKYHTLYLEQISELREKIRQLNRELEGKKQAGI